MNVTTYWDDPETFPINLLNEWAKSWFSKGFNTRILTEAAARRHRRFDEMQARVKKLKSQHSTGYLKSVFNRWLANAMIGESGIFCDVDVINYSLTPDMVPTDGQLICLDSEKNSACVYATPKGLEGFIDALINTNTVGYQWNGKPHVCDMMIFWEWYSGPHFNLCVKNSFPERLTAPVVHFQNDSVKPEWRFSERWQAAVALSEERKNDYARSRPLQTTAG